MFKGIRRTLTAAAVVAAASAPSTAYARPVHPGLPRLPDPVSAHGASRHAQCAIAPSAPRLEATSSVQVTAVSATAWDVILSRVRSDRSVS